jgi:putative oxidoreductase
MKEFFTAWSPRVLSILRIVTGFMFLWHGSQKLFAFPSAPPVGPDGTPPPFAFLAFAGTLELVGGVLLVVGLFVRPIAFLLSGMMAVGYFTVHAAQGFLPIVNGGELAALYCFVFLYLLFAGGGELSLEKVIEGSKQMRSDLGRSTA